MYVIAWRRRVSRNGWTPQSSATLVIASRWADRISEMRIHVGAGYRVYFTRRAKVVYVLICGGDKSSQKRDIKRAKQLLKLLPKE
jgi:putative addiction module killer protein